MNDKEDSMILYGVPISQPVRAVIWTLLLKGQDFELIMINPGSKGDMGSRHPNYLRKSPSGTIPCIEERRTGFVLSEAHAILCYLCRKNSWHDLYPSELRTRAKIDSYLHYHHRGARDASLGLFAPKVRKDLDIPELMQTISLSLVTRTIKVLESAWLAESPFLAGKEMTIADIAAYVEIGQLHQRFTNLFDFNPYPNVCTWLDRMSHLEHHDNVHASLLALGKIDKKSPTIEDIKNANKMGYALINKILGR